jgi:hypothetical protein
VFPSFLSYLEVSKWRSFEGVPEGLKVTVTPPGVLVQLQALQVAQREEQVLLKLQTPHQPCYNTL